MKPTKGRAVYEHVIDLQWPLVDLSSPYQIYNNTLHETVIIKVVK